MVCKITDVPQLELLASDLGLPFTCHSVRKTCIRNLETKRVDITGAQGTAIGYCQGLFSKELTPAAHTQHVRAQLESIGAPWAHSHELIYDYASHPFQDYLTSAIEPLKGTGRVPIVISSLDPAYNSVQIDEIISAQTPAKLDTLLLRVAANPASIQPIAALMKRLYADAAHHKTMPQWWPLVAADNFSVDNVTVLKETLGPLQKYLTLAATPMTQQNMLVAHANSFAVAQFFLGASEDVTGTYVKYNAANCSGDLSGTVNYSPIAYAQRLVDAKIQPIAIVCGKSQSGWDTKYNSQRLQNFMPLFKDSLRTLWHNDAKYAEILQNTK